jgi:hypothetical protein
MDIDKMKALALAAKDWKWQTVQGHQFGHYEDGSFYDIGSVDADRYSMDDVEHNATVLNFIAACDPAAVLELIAEVERLRAELAARSIPRNAVDDAVFATMYKNKVDFSVEKVRGVFGELGREFEER